MADLEASRPPHFTIDKNDIHIIASTKSGNGRAEKFLIDSLRKNLSEIYPTNSPYQELLTSSPSTINNFARTTLKKRANEGAPQTILLLSGDGGLVELMNGLLETSKSDKFVPPTVLLFPFGTGNALFHSVHREVATQEADDLSLACKNLLSTISKPLPIFSATFSPGSRLLSDEGRIETRVPGDCLYGAVVASYGFHSQLVADSDTVEYRKHGDKRFQMVAKDLLAEPHAYKARVSVRYAGDTTTSIIRRDSNEHTYLVTSMVSNFEKTFTISPATKSLDGQMRIVEFAPRSGEDIMKVMMGAYAGGENIEADSSIGYRPIEWMRIEFNEEDTRWRKVCVDGLIVAVEEGGWLEVQSVPLDQSPLSIVCPYKGDASTDVVA